MLESVLQDDLKILLFSQIFLSEEIAEKLEEVYATISERFEE